MVHTGGKVVVMILGGLIEEISSEVIIIGLEKFIYYWDARMRKITIYIEWLSWASIYISVETINQ